MKVKLVGCLPASSSMKEKQFQKRRQLGWLNGWNAGLLSWMNWVGYEPEAPLPRIHFIPQITFAPLRPACPITHLPQRRQSSPIFSIVFN